jgi:Cu(I)/Ag(I) efflux system periplasmic protein CusF
MIRMISMLAAAVVASAAQADDTHHKKDPTAAGARASAMAEGEIRKVDKDARKITIKHGPLEALDMPAMTMVFHVQDPAMLEQVKPGDKVRFNAEKRGGAFTITEMRSMGQP